MSVTHGLASYTHAGFVRVGTIVYCLCALASPRHALPLSRLLSPCLCGCTKWRSAEVGPGRCGSCAVAVCCCRLYYTLPKTVIVLMVVQRRYMYPTTARCVLARELYLRLRCIESKSTFSSRTLHIRPRTYRIKRKKICATVHVLINNIKWYIR